MLAFCCALREHGYTVSIAEVLAAVTAAQCAGALDRTRCRVALRSALCRDRAQWRRFDPLFDAWFTGRADADSQDETAIQGVAPRSALAQASVHSPARQLAHASVTGGGAAVGDEALQSLDLGRVFDPRTLRDIDAWMDALTRRLKREVRRRHQRGGHARVRLSRTLRRAHGTGGEPFKLVHTKPQRRLPQLVVFVDVSQSMAAYSRFFLQFAKGLAGAFERCEVYGFDTELIALGDFVRPARTALPPAMQSVAWRGGTRIAHAVEAFMAEHANSVLNSRSRVLFLSDGYDTAPPEQLARQLARLRPRVKRVLWLHPLLAREHGAPLDPCLRMAAQSIDRIVPAHSLDALSDVFSEII